MRSPEQSCVNCGCVLSNARSHPHHRAFFAFVKFAFENWPENRETTFTPCSAEELRAWSLVKAGHCTPVYLEFSTEKEAKTAVDVAMDIYRRLRSEGFFAWVVPHKKGIAIMRPDSISFKRLSQRRFNEVSEAAIAAIEHESGLSFDTWKHGEMEAA
jgi:hypothetical protein